MFGELLAQRSVVRLVPPVPQQVLKRPSHGQCRILEAWGQECAGHGVGSKSPALDLLPRLGGVVAHHGDDRDPSRVGVFGVALPTTEDGGDAVLARHRSNTNRGCGEIPEGMGPTGFGCFPRKLTTPKHVPDLFVNSPGLAKRTNELLDMVFVKAPCVRDLLYVADRVQLVRRDLHGPAFVRSHPGVELDGGLIEVAVGGFFGSGALLLRGLGFCRRNYVWIGGVGDST